MQTFFIQQGPNFSFTTDPSFKVLDKLPAANYIIKRNQQTGELYLSTVESFEVPTKMYGNVNFYTDRIINTFFSRPAQTGVLLVGEKGSGKTVQSKIISLKLAEQGVPTIIINTPLVEDDFKTLIQKIAQPALIIFDEFEKVYLKSEGKQEQLLTLLDGTFSSKKLFIFTANDEYAIDTHMINRPGRIFYGIRYDGIDEAAIVEYCNENLVNKGYLDEILELSSKFDKFNFDMLKAFVEEINRYGETPKVAAKLLNFTVTERTRYYSITVEHPDNKDYILVPQCESYGVHLDITSQFNIRVNIYDNIGDIGNENAFKRINARLKKLKQSPGQDDNAERVDFDDEGIPEAKRLDQIYVMVRPIDLIDANRRKGDYKFKTAQGFIVTLTENKFTQKGF